MSNVVEITGIFLGERFRRDDFLIGQIRLVNGAAESLGLDRKDLRGPLSVLGDAEPGALKQQVEYRFYGRLETNHTNAEKYGPQFRFQTFVRAAPHSRESVCRYLQDCPHIGPATANQLWERFGADAVRILRESPEVAAAAVKLLAGPARGDAGKTGKTKAEEAADKLLELHALESVSIEMMDLLAGQGFPRDTSRKSIKDYGNRAPELLRRNPYLLMRYRGIGFAKTDKLYLHLGLPPAAIKRQALCAWYSLASDSNGHTWLPLEHVRRGIKAHVGGVDVEPEKALALAIRGKLIAVRTDADGQQWAAEYKKAAAEERLRKYVLAAMDEPSPWEGLIDHERFDEALAPLTDHQRGRLLSAMTGTICILGGSPGTGKTYSAAALLRGIVDIFGAESVGVAAPTGKAAVRLSESMERYNLPLRARTIHSLLGVESADDGDGWSFKYGDGLTSLGQRKPKLPYRWLVLDETSMNDVPLMASVLAARGRGTGVLLVGDVHQLPPVGHGAPLRDLIASGIPYAELTEIKRNAGTIVEACAAIRDGNTFTVDRVDDLDPEPSDPLTAPRNLTLLPASTPERCIDRMFEALNIAFERFKYDQVWDCQIIIAVNKRSPLCRVNLNKLLQDRLNATGTRTEGSSYRIGDKCIVLKNSFFREVKYGEDSKEKIYVANGEFNEITAVYPKYMVSRFWLPDRTVAIPCGRQGGAKEGGSNGGNDENGGESGGGDNGGGDGGGDGGTTSFDLGYAATCHKIQGSSAKAVIVMLDDYPGASGKHGICDRHWIYTAISRAEKLCILVGRMSIAKSMIDKVTIDRRKTFLADDIKAERLWCERVWWQESGNNNTHMEDASNANQFA